MRLLRRILLTDSQKKELAGHSKRCMPNESCAILLGSISGETAAVKEAVLEENADASPVRFSIKPDRLFSAYARAESDGLDVVGVFHSHPNSEAEPSETDKKFMLTNPGVWVIYSETSGRFAAYCLDGEESAYSVEIYGS